MNATLESELARQVPALGAVLAGKYRVDALLGRGGMGVVYRATNLITEKAVAIKWLLPGDADDRNARERFVREARAAARIPHPNVVDVYDVVEHEGSMFLVMEYLVGEPLSARLARGGLAIADLIRLLLPAMRAVAAAHAGGVIHRDLKPENLFVCTLADGVECLKVLDFGISKIVNARDYEQSLTRSGSAVGTPRYMPVEQLSGDKNVDQRVDVYAFGVILYQALTGQLPFDGDSYGAIAISVATHTPELPRNLRPDIPPLLERAVLGAMARDRAARFPTMDAFIKALEAALEPARDLDGTLSATRPALPVALVETPARAPQAVVRERTAGRVMPWLAIVAAAVSVLLWLALRGAPEGTSQPQTKSLPSKVQAGVGAAPAAASSEPAPNARSELPTPSAAQAPVAADPEPVSPPAPAPAPKRIKQSPRHAGSRSKPAARAPTTSPTAPTAVPLRPTAAPAVRVPDVPEKPAPAPAPTVESNSVRHRAGELEKAQF